MKRIKKIIIIIIIITMLISLITGLYVVKLREPSEWSIGIYMGENPLNNFVSHENVSNPVLTIKDVTDIQAEFVADPFMVKENSTWYMFFEVLNSQSGHGDIALAVSNNGLDWVYKQIVLDEPFHLAYPYVFKWGNEYYMIPDSYSSNSVRLYKAVDFPVNWSLVRTLLQGNRYVDSSVFYYNNKWWMFTTIYNNKSDNLHLYYADDLMLNWTEHPQSPLITGNTKIARSGGRVLIYNNSIIRYTQDDFISYGNKVKAFEITELTTTSYKEKEAPGNPILKASGFWSGKWNAKGMHNIDPHQIGENKWIAVVDGLKV